MGKEFKTVATFIHNGLECEIVEVNFSPHMEISHNGYVTVPKDNSNYGLDYNDVKQDVVELTFGEEGKFGFDTNHYGDTTATKSKEAVIAKTKKLAEKLGTTNG